MNAAFFFSGVTMASFAASGLFFIRFWMASRDRFFLLFGIASFLISFERVVALFTPAAFYATPEAAAMGTLIWINFIRLMAFIVIAVAIWDKNRTKKV